MASPPTLYPLNYWYAKKVNKPYGPDLSPLGAVPGSPSVGILDRIYINVYAEDYTVSTTAAMVTAPSPTSQVADYAAYLIYDYYGKDWNAAATAATNPPRPTATQFRTTRPGGNGLWQYEINKDDILNLPDSSQPSGHPGGSSTGAPYAYIKRKHIDKFLQHIRLSFKVYQQQLKFYNGSITPTLNFLDLLNQTELFFENLKNFVAFNGEKWGDIDYFRLSYAPASAIPFFVAAAPQAPPFSPPDATSPRYGVQYVWGALAVTAAQIPGDPDHVRVLNKGINFHFVQNRAASGVSLQNLIFNFNPILSNKRSQINWKQFVKEYLPNIKVDPHGKPRTPTVAEEISQQQQESDLGVLGSTEADAAATEQVTNNPRTAERAFQEANKEIAESETRLQAKLDKFVNKVQDVASEVDAVAAILNKYNVTALIEAALECLLFHTPGYSGTMPDFVPGIDPFVPKPPRVKIRFPRIPTRLAIPSINKEFRLQLRNGLRQAALASVMGILSTLADLIKDMCIDNANANDVPSDPIPDVVANFLDPLALSNSNGDPLGECYAAAGLGSPEIQAELTAFFTALSPLISAREMCDLLNGTPSNDVKAVVDNLLNLSLYAQVRSRLSDIDAALQLFECIGDLIDPAFCQNIYNAACAPLPEADPCLVEEMPAWVDLVELLENLDDLISQPDMRCGGNIVPSPGAHPPFVHTITDLIDGIISAAQQVYMSDLGGFKQSLLTIDPENAGAVEAQELLNALQEAMPQPNAPTDTGDVTNTMGAFFTDLIPSSLTTEFEAFQQIGTQLGALGADPMANIADLQSRLSYKVAPATKEFYRLMEANIATSRMFTDIDTNDLSSYSPNDALNLYAFLTEMPMSTDSTSAGHGKQITYSITGHEFPYAGSLDLWEENPYSDQINVYGMHSSTSAQINQSMDISLNPTLDAQAQRDLRGKESAQFSEDVLSLYNTLAFPQAPLSGPNASAWDTVFKKKYYPFAYFSLINSTAYRISNSPLFGVDAMNKLNIFPKFCAGSGDIAGADLLDVDSIKQKAINEFIQNSCNEGPSVLGKIREAALLGIVSVYFQVLLVDMLLKNIFIVSLFGSQYLSSPKLIYELSTQLYLKIIGSFNFNFFVSAGLPSIVKKSAALVVRNMVVRDGTTFQYPITGQQPAMVSWINTVSDTTPLTDPALEQVAIRWMLEDRISNSAAQVAEVFNIRGDSVIETFLYEGILDVDIFDPESAREYELGTHSVYSPWSLTVFDGGGTAPNTTGYSIAGLRDTSGGVHPVSAGDRAYAFYTGLNYVDDSETLFLAEMGGANLNPIAEANAKKEIAGYQDMGVLVKERYIEVNYNPTAIDTAIASMGAVAAGTTGITEQLEIIKAYFDVAVPIDSWSTFSETHIIPFDTFIALFSPFADMYASAEAVTTVGNMPIPFYLMGSYPKTQSGASPLLPLGASNAVGASYIALQEPGFDDSTKMTMSDYKLIRFWMRNVARAFGPDSEQEVMTGAGSVVPNASRRAQIADGPAGGAPIKAIPFSYDLQNTVDLQYLAGSADSNVIPAMRCDRIKTWIYENQGGLSWSWVNQQVTPQQDIHNEWRYCYNDYNLQGAIILGIEGPSGPGPGATAWMSDPRAPDHNQDGMGDTVMPNPPEQLKMKSANFEIHSVAFQRTWRNNDPTVVNIPEYLAGSVSWMMFPSPGYPLGTQYFNMSDGHWNDTYPNEVQFFLSITDTRTGAARSFLDFYSGQPAWMESQRENYNAMVGLMEEYETEAELVTALTEVESGAAITELLENIFTKIEMKNRISYITPEFHRVYNAQQDFIFRDLLAHNKDMISAYKSFYPFATTNPTDDGPWQCHFATDYSVGVNVTDQLFSQDFLDFLTEHAAAGPGLVGGFSRYVEDVYQNIALPELVPAMANLPGVKELFGDNHTIDLTRILQYLYLSGEYRTWFDLFTGDDIFGDTKNVLILAMEAAFAGDDYTATSNCDVSAVENAAMNGVMDAMGPFADLGKSFINKMLKETPKHILKGVVEMTEPHVILAKLIKDVSRQGFQQMAQIVDAGNNAATLAAALANAPELQPPCHDEPMLAPSDISGPVLPAGMSFDDILNEIQNHIDLNYPADMPAALKPTVTKENGIDLEGTIPYTFFVPPLTPFGIIYLLLQLGEFPFNQVQTSDDPTDCT